MKSSEADLCFVISNRDSKNWEKETRKKTLMAWSFHIRNPGVRLWSHVLLSGSVPFQQMSEGVICVDFMKQILLGTNCTYPGSSSLILNLFTQHKRGVCEEIWEFEYDDGIMNQVFMCDVGEVWWEKDWKWSVDYFFVEFQVVLLGVLRAGHVKLNPGGKIRKGDTVFCIAQSEEVVQNCCKIGEREFLNSQRGLDISLEVEVDRENLDEIAYGHDENIPSHIRIARPTSPYTTTSMTRPPKCYLLRKPTSRSGSILTTTDLKDHIIVCCGTGDEGRGNRTELFDFICTLRSSHVPFASLSPILIIGDEPSDEEINTSISPFPEVYYMVGDAMLRLDLLRASLCNAKTVLILSKPENGAESSIADADAVMKFHVVYQVLTEIGLVDVRDAGFRDGGEDKQADGVVGPVEQLVDEKQKSSITITSKNEGTPEKNAVIVSKPKLNVELVDRRNIRFIHSIQSTTPIKDHLHSPVYASGQVVVSGILDTLVPAVYRNAHVVKIILGLCGRDGNDGGSIMTVDGVPGKSYTWMFRKLCEKGRIPVGIWRAPNKEFGNAVGISVANPMPGTLVRDGDRVYVLTSGVKAKG